MTKDEERAREFFGCKPEGSLPGIPSHSKGCSYLADHGTGPTSEWACVRLRELLRDVREGERERAAGVVDAHEIRDCGDYYHDYCHCAEQAKEDIAEKIRTAPEVA